MTWVFQTLTLLTFLPCSPVFAGDQYSGLRKAVVEVTSSERVKNTEFLFIPILSELVDQGRQDTSSLSTRLWSFFDSSYDPNKLYKDRLFCLDEAFTTWIKFAQSGAFDRTDRLLQSLQKGLKPECQRFVSSLWGKDSRSYAHGLYLRQLILNELIVDFQKRKLANLEAVYANLVRADQTHLNSATLVAGLYMRDSDPAVRARAGELLDQIAHFSKLSPWLDWVRTDSTLPLSAGAIRMAGAFISRLGQVGLLKSKNIAIAQGIAASAAVHVVAGHSLRPNDQRLTFDDSGFRSKLSTLKIADEGRLKSQLEDRLNSFSYDLASRKMVEEWAESVIRPFTRYSTDGVSLAEFLVENEFSRDQTLFPLNYNQIVLILKSVSRNLEGDLEPFASIDPQDLPRNIEVIDDLRSKIFSATHISRYGRVSPSLSHLVMGEDGNCVANTQLVLSLLWPYRNRLGGWQLGLQVFSNYVQPVLFMKSKNVVIDLVTGRLEHKVVAAIYDPLVLVNGVLKQAGNPMAKSWSSFLIAAGPPLRGGRGAPPDVKSPPFMLPQSGIEASGDAPESATIQFSKITDRKQKRGGGGTSVSEPFGEVDQNFVYPYTTNEANAVAGNYRSCNPFSFDSPGHKETNPSYDFSRWFSPFSFEVFSQTRTQPERSAGMRIQCIGFRFKTDTDRDYVAASSSGRSLTQGAVADRLPRLMDRDLLEPEKFVLGIKDIMNDPKARVVGLEEDSPERDAAERFWNLFTGIQSMVKTLIHLKKGTASDDELNREVPFVTYSLLPRFSSISQQAVSIVKLITAQPKKLLEILDDAEVPHKNRKLLADFIQYSAIAARSSGGYYQAPEDVRVEVERMLRSLAQTFNSPRLLGISQRVDPKIKDDSSPPLLHVPSPDSEIKAGTKLTVNFVLPLCQSEGEEKLGRCRKQPEYFHSDTLAAIYVSPTTFLHLFTLFARTAESVKDLGIHYDFGGRWNDQLEVLYLDKAIESSKASFKDFLKESAKGTDLESYYVQSTPSAYSDFQPFIDDISLVKLVANKHKNSGHTILHKEFLFENGNPTERMVTIPTSSRMEAYRQCFQRIEKRQTNAPKASLQQIQKIFAGHVKCLERARDL